jgi:hypothetical protein
VELLNLPVKCTTPEPAKSRAPIPISGSTFVILKNPLFDQAECATFENMMQK